VERFLPGREFTVGLAGTGSEARVLGTLEVHLLAGADAGVYSYENKARYEERVAYRRVLPEGDEAVREAEVLALGAWRLLGCRDAGRVDLRCDGQGRPQFVEVNPLAGLHPVHSDLPILCREMGLPYSRLIEAIVQSAARRIGGMRLRAAEATDANRSCA
jgi:D-alanine-D-alanine ligase